MEWRLIEVTPSRHYIRLYFLYKVENFDVFILSEGTRWTDTGTTGTLAGMGRWTALLKNRNYGSLSRTLRSLSFSRKPLTLCNDIQTSPTLPGSMIDFYLTIESRHNTSLTLSLSGLSVPETLNLVSAQREWDISSAPLARFYLATLYLQEDSPLTPPPKKLASISYASGA